MADPGSLQLASPPDVREALHLSEERFRLLVDGVVEYAIFMLDPAGRVSSWNRGAERIKQYRADEIIGCHFSRFYPPEDIAARKPEWELEQALRHGSVEDEGWRIRRDGSRFWANVVITTLRDTHGGHVGFAKVTRDLTAKHQAEEEARLLAQQLLRESDGRFARFTDRLPGLAWIKDLDGRYTYFNDAAARAFGRPPAEIIGFTDEELFPAECAAQFRANDLRALAEATGIEVVEQFHTRDGGLRHSIVSKFPIVDGEGRVKMLGGIAVDITERVNAEAALRETDRYKNQFLATLAHELRNPLAPIRNGVHLLRNEPDPVTSENIHRMLDEQLGHLIRLVDDLLEISRITSGKVLLKMGVVDLREIIRSAVDATAALVEAKRHDLAVPAPAEPIMVMGDAVRLTQIMTNLLDNAAKYTPDGGHISVSLEADSETAVIVVCDDGLGIPPELLPRIFDMFAQVDHTLQRANGGLGIGLALVRSLVELHGGSVQARSAGRGRGAEFTVRLARSAEHERGAATVEEHVNDPITTRVLVVDDSRDGADTLAMVLQRSGLDARVAYDGASALGMIRSWQPSIVLMDIGMPGLDGYAVARQVRQEPTLAKVRMIALTGWGGEQDRQRSREAGFDEHWVKPIDPAQIRSLLVTKDDRR